jgi:hypothetical protein
MFDPPYDFYSYGDMFDPPYDFYSYGDMFDPPYDFYSYGDMFDPSYDFYSYGDMADIRSPDSSSPVTEDGTGMSRAVLSGPPPGSAGNCSRRRNGLKPHAPPELLISPNAWATMRKG